MSQAQPTLLRMHLVTRISDNTGISKEELIRCFIPSFVAELKKPTITFSRCQEILEISNSLKDSREKSNLVTNILEAMDVVLAEQARVALTLVELMAIRKKRLEYSEDGFKRLNAAGKKKFEALLREEIRDGTLSGLVKGAYWTIDYWCPKGIAKSIKARLNDLLRKELRLPGIAIDRAVEIYKYEASTQTTKNLAARVMANYF